MLSRIQSSDQQISINGVRMSGVQSFSLSNPRQSEIVNNLGFLARPVNILSPEQTSESTIEFQLPYDASGISSDPFFDIQSSGILSVEKFTLSSIDLAGETVVSGAYLTNYSVSCAVGEPVIGSVSYEGEPAIFNTGSFLVQEDQTDDNYKLFRPSNIFIYPDFSEGVGTSGHCIQNFSLSLPIERNTITRISQSVPKIRYPAIPIFGELSMSVIKKKLDEIDMTNIVAPTGSFAIDLCDRENNTLIRYSISGCYLEGFSSDTSLDENIVIDFSYKFPLSNTTFFREAF